VEKLEKGDVSPLVEISPDHARQRNFLRLASMFAPQSAVGFKKVRMGSDFDGGYVMLDDFKEVDLALSFGIDTNADWDLAVANRGVPVQQYDHTVGHSPVLHQLITFFSEMIVGSSLRTSNASIRSILKKAGTNRDASVILKADIESDEWSVFDNCAPEDLRRFSQIIVEFHDFSHAVDDGWLQMATRVLSKLTTFFFVFHVHGNNWSPMATISNVHFPDVLEVSFANRERYSFTKNEELFPTSLDRPNDPRRPDLYLGAFRYAQIER
jgi:hypothetical protein